jgi:ribosome-binding ATPase
MPTIALLGAPNSGKSCLFRALTGGAGGDAPYPFSTELPIAAPCTRPDLLPATIVDTPGIARNSHAGEWLGLDWIEPLRGISALVVVTKAFQTGAGPIEQPGCTGDPLRDLEILERELLIADVHAVEARLEAVGPDALAREMLEQVGTALAGGQPAREMGLGPDEMTDLTGVLLLTRLPVAYACNVDEWAVSDPLRQAIPELLAERLAFRGVEPLLVCARLEADAALLGPDEGEDFLGELGVDRPLAERLAYAVAQALGHSGLGG